MAKRVHVSPETQNRVIGEILSDHSLVRIELSAAQRRALAARRANEAAVASSRVPPGPDPGSEQLGWAAGGSGST